MGVEVSAGGDRHVERGRLLVVSHPCVVPANQSVYARLAELGWDPIVVVPDRWRHEYEAGDFAPVPLPGMEGRLRPLRIVSPGRPQRHFYLGRPRAVLRALRPRVVFAEAELFSIAAFQWGTAAARAGIPFGVQAAENLPRRLPAPARAIRRVVLARADFLAARSPAAGELARAWGACGEVVFVPHGVPEWDVPARRSGAPFTIGFAGRLVEEKGVLDLLEAVSLVGGEVRLLVVGDGPLRHRVEQQSHAGTRVEVRTGVPHERMAEAYAEMDVLVLPSRTTPRWSEQFGRVIPEALWCGVPVIGSDSGEIPWLIGLTEGGLVYPEGDVRALAGALARLAADAGLRQELARRGRGVVERELGVQAAAKALDGALLSAIDRRQGSVGARSAAAGARFSSRKTGPVGRSSTRPRVALVAHGIHDRGGMERAFAELIRGVSHDVDIVVVANELAPELRPLVDDWIRIRVPSRPIPLKYILFFAIAGFRLWRCSYDLVHTMGALVPNRADVASVQYCHAGHRQATGALAPPEAPPLRRLNTTIARLLAIAAERWCYRRSRLRVLAPVSQGVARELERSYPGIEIAVTPNGVDPERFRPDASAREELRLAEAVPDDEVVALFVGGNWDRKGLSTTIDAIAAARREGAPLTLWVVGAGDRHRYEAQALDSGLGGSVRFFGTRVDTERFYQAADVFVFPTLYEAFPLVALEAAASGLPLVATPVNGVEELLEGGRGGILVEPRLESVAAALVRLAGSPVERRRLGSEARERALRYTWSRSVGSVAAIYRSLLTAQEARAMAGQSV